MVSKHQTGRFEGQRQDRASIADRVATYGLKVFCTDCGLMHRHRTGRGERLRNVASPCCGARMRPGAWKDWDLWRSAPVGVGREEPEKASDAHVARQGSQYYMKRLDS